MLRRKFLKGIMLSAAISAFPKLVLATTKNDAPNVLLLGDSISLGYTNYVKSNLEGKINFFRPLNAKGGYVNCSGTTNGVAHIDEWLGLSPKWGLIHFNFGLHDLKHVNPVSGKNSSNQEDPQQANPKAYKKNLTTIVEKLKATNATLIFATTTSYPENPGGPLRKSDQPAKYNKVARKIMKKFDVEINDLNELTVSRLEELQKPSNVHFTKKGSEVLGKQVVEKISKALSL